MLSYVPGSSIHSGIYFLATTDKILFSISFKSVYLQHYTQKAFQEGIFIGKCMALVMGMICLKGCESADYLNITLFFKFLFFN